MNKAIQFLFVVFLLFPSASFSADKVIAEYGKDNKITEEQITQWLMLSTGGRMPENKNSFDELSDRVKKDVIKQYVLQKELVNIAEKSSIHDSKSFQHQLKNAQNALMVRMYLDKYAGRKVTDSKLKNQYKKYVKIMKNSDDLEVSHILMESEGQANEVYKKLKKGEDFGSLAAKHSLDKSTKAKKGKFGKINKGQIFPEYEKAAYKLRKNQISKPVKTQVGWFVIKLDDRAKKNIPSFDKVKPQLEMIVKEEIISQYISKIAGNSKIDFKS
ncbi:MAG: peptidylprolyl isomerase [Rickettsiales bacterium]